MILISSCSKREFRLRKARAHIFDISLFTFLQNDVLNIPSPSTYILTQSELSKVATRQEGMLMGA